MPIFNTSNPFRSSSSSTTSKTQSSARRAPSRKPTNSTPNGSRPTPARPPPDPRLVSIGQLDSATQRLSDLRKSFVLPTRLTFQPNHSKLDYSPGNAPFHAHDEALTKLLIELDGIDSCGGEMEIRTRRKGLVCEVEKELEKLDEIKKREYQRQVEGGPSKEMTTEQCRTQSPSLTSAGETAALPDQRAGRMPPLPPGIPLPPRDYPQTRSPSNDSRSYGQAQHAHPPPTARRPSYHYEHQELRPPPAQRYPGARTPHSTSPWNAHENPKSRY